MTTTSVARGGKNCAWSAETSAGTSWRCLGVFLAGALEGRRAPALGGVGFFAADLQRGDLRPARASRPQRAAAGARGTAACQMQPPRLHSDSPWNDVRRTFQVREDPLAGVYVEGLSEVAVTNPHQATQRESPTPDNAPASTRTRWHARGHAQVLGLVAESAAQRATGSTTMNRSSSRSHAMLLLRLEQVATNYLTIRHGRTLILGHVCIAALGAAPSRRER